MIAKDQITGIVLAGGKSSRFGSNKALYQFEGITLLERSIHLLTPFCHQVFVSGECEAYKSLSTVCISDIISDIGPLGGIYSAMMNIDSPHYLFMTWDMPLMNYECIKKLLSIDNHIQMTYWHDRSNNLQLFPLLISKSLLKAIVDKINHHSYNICSLIDNSHNQSFDILSNDQNCLLNINYLADIVS